ncbi:MAG TPA: DUF4232 domain-containing protein [Jatrophihabitans sp.]|nr:DUF4232 domain-containing protein [Jatrophihabitans sp.]
MNTNELEDAIRAELRAEVRQAPSGGPTKAAVLQATRELPASEHGVRHLKRWTVPLLAAAVVVLVAVGLTVGGRVLNSSRPEHRNQPANQQTITPPPPSHVACSVARGESLVNGLQTSYTVSATGERRYVFEYYCAGSDGHRTGSALQVFKMVDGRLLFLVQALRPGAGSVVMSLSGGGEDGFRDREADLMIAAQQHGFYGAVGDGAVEIDGDRGTPDGISVIGAGGPSIAQACISADLTVRLASAQQPTPHQVLQLTNSSNAPCALWGNPHYTPLTADETTGRQPVSYLLRGPAGGVTTAPSAPVVVLNPGATAGASIVASSKPDGCAETAAVRVVLPDGVALGEQPLRACNIVSYPLVLRAGGDDAADYPTVSQPTGPNACGDGSQLLLGSHPVSTQGGDGAGLVLSAKLVGGQPCTLTGYPGVFAVDSTNAILITAAHSPQGFFGGLTVGNSTPPTVTLTVGQTASALVEWQAAAYAPTSTCERNVRIKLVIGAVGATFNPTIGQVCDLVVHPIVPGDTGSQ